MEYGMFMGILSRVGATMDAEGWITVGGVRIGRLSDGTLSNMGGAYIPFKDVESLEQSGFTNDLVVRFEEGYFCLAGAQGEVYSIQDMTDDGMTYPSNPLDILMWMKRLYPTIDKDLFFEELSMTDMVNERMFGKPDNLIQIGDKFEDTFRMDFQLRLNAAGVTKGTMVSKDRFRAVLNVLTDPQTGHGRNLFYEWLQSLKWDGVPRVRQWFKWSVGASAPVLAAVSEELEDLYLGDVAEAWFVGAVRKQRFPIKHEVVPILIGQQGTGKSSIVNAIAYRDCWASETNVHVTDPAKFLESISGAVVVELGESVQFDADDAAFLKSFISKKADKLRLPYASRAENFPRHFSFISTSNNLRVLTDPTGNRRYFPMYCDPDRSNFRPGYEYDGEERTYGMDVIEQLWAEAYQLELEGRPHIVPERTKGISEIMQECSTVENPAIITINGFLDNPMNGYHEVGAYVCKQIVMDNAWGDRDVSEREKEAAWKVWTDAQRDWKAVSKQVRIGSVVTRSSYQRRFAPGERFKARILKADASLADILDAPAEVADAPAIPVPKAPRPMEPQPSLKDLKDANAIYSNLIRMYGLSPGDIVDSAMLEPDLVKLCVDSGVLLDEDGTGILFRLGAPAK